MCWRQVIVIVIVKSRNDKGTRFEYINVRKQSKMVVRLPQQVLLLLVLVAGTTAETVSEISDWTTPSSNTRLAGTSATGISHSSKGLKGYDASGRNLGHRRRALSITKSFDTASIDMGITINADATASRYFRLRPVFSLPSIESLRYKRTNIEKQYRTFERNEQLNEEHNEENIDSNLQNNWSINGKQRSASFFTDPSINENQSKSILNSKRSIRRQDDRETWTFPSSTIVGTTFEDSRLLHNQQTSESLSLSTSTSLWSASTPKTGSSLSNDLGIAAAPTRSTSMETTLSLLPKYPKSNRVTSSSNRINYLDTQILRLDHKSTNIGDNLYNEKTRNFDDAGPVPSSLAIPAEGDGKDFISPLVRELPQRRDEDTNLPNSTSLIHQDILNPSKKLSEEKVTAPVNFSSIRMITIASLDEFRGTKMLHKPSENLGLSEEISGELTPTLVKEEQVELSTRHLDVPPPNYLSITLVDQPLQHNMQKIHLESSKYERGQFDWLTTERKPILATTWPTTAVGFPKRYIRDAAEDPCEKFQITDQVKREFYSPNYPQNYPANTNCVRTLEAEKGMLLKLDFRDRFELEPMMPVNDKVGECRFDYLEVRDGQYGFSTLLGVFCDKNFPPEIISKSRYLWLRFHSDDTIEYQGFKAVWSTVPRPTTGGVPPEQEPCVKNVTNQSEAIVGIDDVRAEKKIAEQYKVALDCLWIITAPAKTRMQLSFDAFKLDKPNDCGANFLDIFGERTDVPSRLKNFCGSIAESVSTTTNTMYIRFYLEPKAINGTFKSLITVVRDKTSTDKPCNEDEYDCDDATCIALSLKCNSRLNCRFLRDEDPSMCGTTADQFDSSRVIIILVIFSLIMFGMCFAFVFNCVRKLMRDHRIIREHIRQSRENRLDEIGRKMTPCPVSLSRTDLRDHGSESPSVEADSSKELIPATSLIAHEYTKELVLEMTYGTKEMNDIHQSNNMSNATQERLQESSEELEMCDSSCQTRESLFEPVITDAGLSSPAFSTFGYRRGSGNQNGAAPNQRASPQDEHRQHHRHYRHPPPRQSSQQSQRSCPTNSPPSRHPVSEQCSVCVSSTSREGSLVICPKHNPIPAPPGWSLHDPPYHIEARVPGYSENAEYRTYQRYQSPKPDRDPMVVSKSCQQHQHQSPPFTRQTTVGSGERYGSFIYGSGRASSNTASNTTTASNMTGSGSQHSGTSKITQPDPRYRAEAVIEVDQKRPFSMESTKSAPDVIATH